MVEIKLFEFFGVLGVGTFTVLSVIYIAFELQRLFNPKKHNDDAFFKWLKTILSKDYKDTILAVVTVITIYSTGIIMQDVTDRLTDSTEDAGLFKRFPFRRDLLKSEGKLREEALIIDSTTLTHLGKDVFGIADRILNKKRDSLPFFETNEKPQDYWQKMGSEKFSKYADSIENFVNDIYYTCKNWCYLRSEIIRTELEGIQERIDFSRSILLVSYVDTLLIIALYLGYYLNEFRKKKKNRFMVSFPGVLQSMYKKIFIPRMLLATVALVMIAKVGYISAEKNFNERAMGYYVSHLKLPQEETSKPTNSNPSPMADQDQQTGNQKTK